MDYDDDPGDDGDEADDDEDGDEDDDDDDIHDDDHDNDADDDDGDDDDDIISHQSLQSSAISHQPRISLVSSFESSVIIHQSASQNINSMLKIIKNNIYFAPMG